MPVPIHAALLTALPGALEPFQPLFEPVAVGRALAVARMLPPAFDRIGFEARLAAGESHLDLGICVQRADAADLVPSASGVCARFLSRWLEPGGVLESHVPQTWFELDVDDDATQDCGPWNGAFPFARLQSGACGPHSIDTLCQVACALTEQASPASVRPLFEALPSDAYVLHASALQHRGANELRLEFVAGTSGLLEWLAARGVSVGDQPMLRIVLAELPIRQVAVQLSYRDCQLVPHSLELDLGHHVDQAPVWATLFEKLMEAGLACDQKLQALRAWPGSSLQRLNDEPVLVRLTRSFHVTLKLGARLEAKAYPYLAARYALC